MTVGTGFKIMIGVLGLLVILFFVVEGVRETIYLRLLEAEWPAPGPGAPAVPVEALSWKDMRFAFHELLDNDSAKRRLNVGDIVVQFPRRIAAAYDPSCGMSCNKALVIKQLVCTGKVGQVRGGVAIGPDSSCALHLWESDAGQTACFVSVDKVVGMDALMSQSVYRAIGVEPKPRDVYLECPGQIHWRAS